MTDGLAARFLTGLAGAGAGGLALAVSGGGDSIAMLHLAAKAGLRVHAVTVDHGLRPQAADEAAGVGRICAGIGVPHKTLHWHWDGTGNLQDAARRGRRTLMADWALRQGLTTVALAHTRDDVAETFLMRLSRGAGVDGLAAMASDWHANGVRWLRPLLAVSRADLRDWLVAQGLPWVEDPSNDNPRFDRVRARRALALLAPTGINAEGLAAVAGHLAEARMALEAVADAAMVRVVQDRVAGLVLDRDALAGEAAEIQRRVLVKVILTVAPAGYAPRGHAVQMLLGRLLAGRDGVLAGCRFQGIKGRLWAFREARAVAGLTAGPGAVWDRRWQIVGDWPPGGQVRALGQGLVQCDWRATGLPREVLLASPALWQGDQLIAAPLAGYGAGYSAKSLLPAAGLHQLP